MSVDKMAGGVERAVPETGPRGSDKEDPPIVPMSDTPDTLAEPTASPHLHRPYYRSLLRKT